MQVLDVARHLRHASSRLWFDALDLVLPTACAACGRMIEGGGVLCDVCDARVHDLARMPHCARCASPLPDARGPCGRCRDAGIRPLAAVARLGTFESTTRDLVHAIKYGRRWAVVEVVGAMLRDRPRVAAILSQTDVVVPVPLHWWRRFHRGFNQSELLARSIARPFGVPVVRAIAKTRRTTSQTAYHSRRARRMNVVGAFRVTNTRALDGRRVTLVDDVMTSGATLQTVARTIRRACRPESISAVVIATANPLRSELVAV